MKNIFLCCGFFSLSLAVFGQESPGYSLNTEQEFGAQLGYSYSQVSKIDLGANFYWSKKKLFTDTKTKDIYHTFGPFISVTGIFANHNFYVGKQIGFNYHYDSFYCPRLTLAYEDNFHTDKRIGAEIGASFLGLFLYGGYYYPVGKMEANEISRFRIGIRLIFNEASIIGSPIS